MANRFSKPKEEIKISDSLQDALIYLNRQNIEEGKIYSRRYFSTSAKTSVDVVLAVGVINGVGPNCYSIISHTKKTVVWGVSDKLPDVSEVTLGRLYIFWDSTKGLSYLVYLLSGNRIVEPVKFPLIVYNTEDGHYYYVSSDHIVDIYEHLEESYVLEERITALEKQVKDLIDGGGSDEDITTPTPPPAVDPDEPEEPEEITTTTTTTPKPSVNLVINSFRSVSGDQFEVGETISPKLSWSYNIPITTQSINGESMDASLREKTCEEITEDTTYTLRAEEGSSVKTKELTIKFSPKAYVGASPNYEISDVTSSSFSEIFTTLELREEGLSNVMCKGSVEKTFTIETDDSSIMMAFPEDIAASLSIIDIALNSPVVCNKKEVTVTNDYGVDIDYIIFESPSIYASGTVIKWKFNFN